MRGVQDKEKKTRKEKTRRDKKPKDDPPMKTRKEKKALRKNKSKQGEQEDDCVLCDEPLDRSEAFRRTKQHKACGAALKSAQEFARRKKVLFNISII